MRIIAELTGNAFLILQTVIIHILEEIILCIIKNADKFWESMNGNSNLLYCFGSLFDTPDQLEGRFPMPGTEGFVR